MQEFTILKCGKFAVQLDSDDIYSDENTPEGCRFIL